MGGGFAGADLAGGFVAIHFGHLAIHEDDVEVAALPGAHRLFAVGGDFDRAADSLGHIAVAEKTMLLADVMAAEGDTSARADLLNGSADTLARRGVLPGVVEALRQQ